MPSQTAEREQTSGSPVGFLWDLNLSPAASNAETVQTSIQTVKPTATPQLIKAINFEEAFSSSPSSTVTSVQGNVPALNGGNDRAEWLYFSPAEYSTDALDTLYAAFKNSGDSVWTGDYYLEFYAGENPAKDSKVMLSKTVSPGEQASFEIPIKSSSTSWKACWMLKNTASESIYDFCYNHGSGVNSGQTVQAASTGSGSQFDVSHPFYKTEGSAPTRYISAELSADLVSTNPASGHSFQAYDHYESLSATFINNGSESWDSSYALVFYSGYNWMHANSFPLSGSVGPGETTTVTMPMEIFEDHDRWVTCWYLAAPGGKNLADFCFNYFTG
ncbi:MAG: hypothetical protein IJI57_08260 [Flexilinea sp.]|nr:hypothetical protein [Flexilinea sp.]